MPGKQTLELAEVESWLLTELPRLAPFFSLRIRFPEQGPLLTFTAKPWDGMIVIIKGGDSHIDQTMSQLGFATQDSGHTSSNSIGKAFRNFAVDEHDLPSLGWKVVLAVAAIATDDPAPLVEVGVIPGNQN